VAWRFFILEGGGAKIDHGENPKDTGKKENTDNTTTYISLLCKTNRSK
jgi:hypothetical protein